MGNTDKQSNLIKTIWIGLNIIFVLAIISIGIVNITYKKHNIQNHSVRDVDSLELDSFSLRYPNGETFYIDIYKTMSYFDVIDYFKDIGFVEQPMCIMNTKFEEVEHEPLESLLMKDIDDILYILGSAEGYSQCILHDFKNDIDVYVVSDNMESRNIIGVRFMFNASGKYTDKEDKYKVTGIYNPTRFSKGSIYEEDYYDNTGKMGFDLVDGSDIFSGEYSYTLYTGSDQCTYMVWKDFVFGD